MDGGDTSHSFPRISAPAEYCITFIGIMTLGIFSITTGMNQSLGIILFIILFIYNSLGYLLKVSNFYKSEQKS